MTDEQFRAGNAGAKSSLIAESVPLSLRPQYARIVSLVLQWASLITTGGQLLFDINLPTLWGARSMLFVSSCRPNR